jgi:hypothetical protein
MTSTPRPTPGADQQERDLRDAVKTDIERVEEPARLLRVSAMARSLLEEAKGVHLEERARERMHRIYEQAISEIAHSVAPELRDELERLRPSPNGDGTPTEMEIRVMQGQLVGWLEGVFQGIQAGLQLQQVAARQQQLGLRSGGALPSPDGPGVRGDGNYL